jgi:hypothetical protein
MLGWTKQPNNAMAGMGYWTRAGLVAVATLSLGGTALAAPAKCAKAKEVTAIQAAAIQQELMVAALTCNEIQHFNAFQTSFSLELRSADATLEKMFRRLFGYGRGEGQYHAFKTRLANDSSIRSIHNNVDYCHEASTVFAAALAPAKPALADFVAGITVTEESPVSSCDISVASGLSGAQAIPSVVPLPNPVRVAELSPAAAPTAAAAPAAENAVPTANAAPAPLAHTN